MTAASETERLMDSLIDEQLAPWDPVLNYQNMRAVISVSKIATITNLPDVVWIGAFQPPQLMDEKQAQILAGNLNVAAHQACRSGLYGVVKGTRIQ